MFRLTSSYLSLALVTALAASSFGCGDKKPPQTPEKNQADAGAEETSENENGGAAGGEAKTNPDGTPKKDECAGFEIGNLEEVLSKSACEEPGVKPDGLPPVDLKGKLEVTLAAAPTKVAPGGKTDLILSFTNKSKEPLTLHFRIDPVPHFEVEAYDAKKNNRIDMPAGKPPPPPKGVTAPPSSEPKTARVTLMPNGSARTKIAWEAVKTKWAPEKVKGAAPERGYPRSPAGPLGKGKAVVKVVTPLVGVNEGGEKEMSIPKTEIEIGG